MKTFLIIILFVFPALFAGAQPAASGLASATRDIPLRSIAMDSIGAAANSGYVTLAFPAALEDALVVITDTRGKLMLSWSNIMGDVVTFDVSGFEKGEYVISIENKNMVYAGKFLKP